MADCGASGTALDRAATTILSSALGCGGGEATVRTTERAGKAIGAYLGGTAPFVGGGVVGGGIMPTVVPERLVRQQQMQMQHQQMQHQQQQVGGFGGVVMNHPQNRGADTTTMEMMEGKSMDSVWDNGDGVIGTGPIVPTAVGVEMMKRQQQMSFHPVQQQQQQMQMQMQAQAQMQMQIQAMGQMQAMNQQMAMMAMTQQQQQQEQQQSLSSTATADPIAAAITDLPTDFESYLHSTASTAEDAVEHEGYEAHASMEALAAAWSEAEKQIAEDFAEEDKYRYGGAARDTTVDGETEYTFSPQSESYYEDRLRPCSRHSSQTQSSQPLPDLYAEGLAHYHAGDIPRAVLSLESHLRHIDPDSSDAWLHLGKCHAENDEDRRAIACLERAVERDPYNGDATLALGVSYVNELEHGKALGVLKGWVTNNPTYAGYEVGGETTAAGEAAPLEELKSLLRSAIASHDRRARTAAADGSTAAAALPDALETLAVVLNVSREYDEAVALLARATALRPASHALWNKLGATLANSDRSAEALPAYERALELKPRCARVWLNTAISHANRKNHGEAARCYLQTLALNEGAGHVWSYLRVSLTCAERWDLLGLVGERDLEGLREHFEFVRYGEM